MRDEYYVRKLDEVTNTGLSRFRESPLAYLDWVNSDDDDETEAQHDGTAFHCAILEPERFRKTYVAIPDVPLNRKGSKQQLVELVQDTVGVKLKSCASPETFSAESLRSTIRVELSALGTEVVSDDWLATTRSMVQSLNEPRHRMQRNLIARGTKERVIHWVDGASGMKCKARIDSWDGELGIESDVKRTHKITEREFRFACFEREKLYLYQRAFYRRGLRELGDDVSWQPFVCAQPVRPFYWPCYTVPADVLDACDRRISEDLIRLAECINKNDWATINGGEPVELKISAEFI